MLGNIQKIGICALTFFVIGVLQQRSVWALTAASTTTFTETDPDIASSQVTDASNIEENQLISLAKRNIEEIIPASEDAVVIIDETTRYYITAKPATTQETDTPTYRNSWAKLSNAPVKRKLPEPSTILGLIAMVGWLGTQGRK